jgi:hypothetical protein
MSVMNRRESLKALLQGLLASAGTMVLASAEVPAAAASAEALTDLEQRADQLAGMHAALEHSHGWINGAFRNAFANGGFHNGGFANGAFRNGGFMNGGFNNGGFRNGGFANGAFRNF